ncbi:MAG: hypothetical protein K6A65_07765, partial [Succinivibrionaceae bacterium]|nr:hypothetical protein [Succinivibrionaceae bacterium]
GAAARALAEAGRLYAAECDQAHGEGCAALGLLHDQGLLGDRDRQRAQALYHRGCDLGNGTACRRLDRQ